MNTLQLRNSFLLLLTAVIWGVAFVAQSVGMDYVGPYTFTCVRSFIGGLFLIPCIALLNRLNPVSPGGIRPSNAKSKGQLWIGGVCCGVMLCFASCFQQIGIMYTSVGKAGFITSLYIVIVPFFAYFVGQPLRRTAIIGSLLAMIGMYFLAYPTDGASFNRGDILIAICSVVWSIYILLVDRWAVHYAGFTLVAVEFFFASIYNLVLSQLAGEVITLNHIEAALWPILYCGFLGGGLAYSFQFIGQRGVGPTEASLLLSSETVFSVIGGWLILGEILSGRELVGCLFMLMGIISSQIKIK